MMMSGRKRPWSLKLNLSFVSNSLFGAVGKEELTCVTLVLRDKI